ncbi:FkbM family methyltransferase [Candidatus Woesearchaeota archaeon]|nr:FkbM family methyltransferase [Candidatus Woesearchaeota archaeon]
MKILTAFGAIRAIKNWPTYLKDYFKKIKKKHIVYLFRNGLKIKTRAGSSDRGILTEVHILKIYQRHGIEILPNDTVLEIGAHIGTFTILASKKAKKVYSFEPYPENFNLLKENLALNKITNVAPIRKAITEKNGTSELYISNINTGSHSIFPKSEKDNSVTVETTSLPDVMRTHKIKKIGLLKVDCEGAEYPIFFSLPDKTFEAIRQISMEYHPTEKYNIEQLKNLLQKHQFKVTMTRNKFRMIYAKKTATSAKLMPP